MRVRHRLAWLLLCLLVAGAAAQQKAGPKELTPKEKYEALVQRLRSGDQTVDLNELRMAAGAAGITSDPDARNRLFDAAEHEDYAAMAQAAEALLKSNYTDLDGHFFAKQAARAQSKSELVEFHDFVLRGLLRSLRDSGDGTSPDTAVKVIAVDEEYFILRMLNQQPKQQALGTCKGNPCDIMTTTDSETKEEKTWYFDVSIPMGTLSKSLGQKDKK
jgi:hypothetical protein